MNLEGLHILHDVSVEVEKGKVLAIIGPNGAGKTTLMNTLMGLYKPESGRIVLEGVDITSLPTRERVKMGMALVPEGRRIFPELTIHENLTIGANAKPKPQRPRLLESVTGLFPWMKERLSQQGGTLSGGEQQMLAVARSLMSDPRLLLLDEPSLGVAPIMVSEIYSKVVNEVRGSGLTTIIVEQNVKKVLDLADYVYVIESGRIVLEGKPSEIYDENLLKAYMGISAD